MKFKNYIEVQSGIKDSANSPGTLDQVLTSTATGVAWVDPSTISAEAATLVVIECKNTSGATITKGTPVYQTGTVGATDVIEIAVADASDEDKMAAIGLLQTTLNNNGFGKVVITGELLNITTSPIDGVTPITGDTIYVKPGGGLTLTKPTGVNFIQNVGLVGKVSGGNAGSITVSSIMRSNDVPTPLYIDHDDQRLGIGTSSPDSIVDIVGNNPILTIRDSDTSTSTATSTIRFAESNANDTLGNYWDVGYSPVNLLNFDFNSSTKMTITSAGNVGIGTNSPGVKMDVEVDSASAGDLLRLTNSNTGGGSKRSAMIYRLTDSVGTRKNAGYIRVQGTNNNITAGASMEFWTRKGDSNPTESMRISTNGNVGIGTTSPAELLNVNKENAESVILISRGGTNPAASTDIGKIKFASDYSNVVTEYGHIKTYANSLSAVRGSMNFSVKSTSGAVLTGMTVHGTSAGVNVGIGTISPSEKLVVDGKIRSLGDTSSADFYSVGNDALLVNNGTSNMKFWNNGSERMRITSSGNVGIGTTSPENKLHVQQSALYTGIQTTAGIRVKSDGGSAIGNYHGTIALSRGTGSVAISAVQEAADSDVMGMAFFTHPSATGGDAAVEQMRIDQNGNVGIGTTNPAEKLHIENTSGANIILNSNTSAVNNGIYMSEGASSTPTQNGAYFYYDSAANAVKLDTGTSLLSTKLTVLRDSGNVGIGTTTPTAPLHIEGGTNSEVLKIEADANPYIRWVQNGADVGFLQFNGGSAYLSNMANGSFFFRTNNTDKMTILSSGNVGIGTTSPGAFLQVGGTTDSNGSPGSFNVAGSYGVDSWARAYVVSNTNILSILQANNTALQSGGAYRVTGHIDGTGTDQSSRAVFWNQNGTWFCNVTGQSGASSNSISFLVDATTGLPSVKTYHANNYTVRVWHERINLNEGTGTDNSRHYFGADAYMTQIGNDISMFTTTYSGNNTTGKLGIGIVNASERLHVVGNARVTGAYYDSNNSPGTANQVLVSTVSGTDWVDGSGSSIIGGPYLPLTAGSGSPLTGNLYLEGAAQNIRINNGTQPVVFLGDGGANTDGQLILYSSTGGANVVFSGDNQNHYITNGNVGIGTASPGAKLEVNGDIGIGRVAGGYTFRETVGGSERASIKSNATNELIFSYGASTEAMRIDDTGNVGIGTTSPGVKFVVNGGNDNEIAKFLSTDDTAQISISDNDTNAFFGVKNGVAFISQTGGTPASGIAVDSSGNVGIGTTSPGANLEINDASAPKIRFGRGSSYYWDIGHTTSDFQIQSQTGGTIMHLEYTGNVGIGTTSPSAKLQVNNPGEGEFAGANSSAAGDSHLMLKDEGSTSRTLMSGPSIVFQTPANADGTNVWATSRLLGSPAAAGSARGTFSIQVRDQYDPFNDGTSWNWRTCLTAINTGNIGIGTNSPSAKLDVNGAIAVNGTKMFSTIGSTSYIWNNTDNLYVVDDTGNNVQLAIKDNGNVGIGTTSPSHKLEVGLTSSVALASQPAIPLMISNNGNPVDGRVLLQVKHDTVNTAGAIAAGYQMTAAAVTSGTASYYDSLIFLESAGSNSETVHSAPKNIEFYVNNYNTAAGAGTSYTALGNLAFELQADGDAIFYDNVGIGTTSPGAKLEVNGNVAINSTGLTEGFQWFNDTNEIFSLEDTAGSGELLLLSSNSVKVKLNANGSSYLNGGNVGIGTTSPSSKLTIIGDNNTEQVRIGHSTQGLFIKVNQENVDFNSSGNVSGTHTFSTGNVERMRITSTGNVGIGTTSPGDKLHVNGTVRSQAPATSDWALLGYNSAGSAASGLWFDNGDGELLLRDDSGNLNVRLRSDTSSYINGGNLGLGTTSPAQKLTVNSGRMLVSNNTTPIYIKAGSTYKSWVHHIGGSDGYIFAPSTADNGETWDWANQTKLGANGVVTAKNFQLSSDERFKNNIKDIKDIKVEAAFKSFEMESSPGEKRYGVVAQELEKTNPELVETDHEGFKSVKYIDLLIAKIAELEARLEKLEK